MKKERLIWVLAIAALLAADFSTKLLAQKYFLKNPVEILRGILSFRYQLNPNIAFSIPLPNQLMIALTPAALLLFAFFILKACDTKRLITQIALCLIIAGGIGNFINRILYGAVVDFIDFSFWPNFNLADAYLTCAAFLIILFYGKITTSYGKTKH